MDYLVNHALENVWCTPGMDKQYIAQPRRISRNGGEFIDMDVDWNNLYLPNNTDYWIVYQVGQLNPDELGFFPVQNEWVSFNDVANKMGMLAEAYTQRGVRLPGFETYYIVTSSRNLIIATKKQNVLLATNYDSEELYFRVYTNAFWQSTRSASYADKIIAKGFSPKLDDEILTAQSEFRALQNKGYGYAYALINGYYYEEVSPVTCKVGDLVEWIWDGSVKKIVEYPIDSLKNFDSVLDSERKYLLHYHDATATIEYQDDVDLYLIERPEAPGRANGLYHHKNTPAAMRMVTHKDYSVSVQLINAFVDGHPKWTDPQKLNIMAIIRYSGFDRPLVFENNRIHELYKLSDDEIVDSMVGDNSVVPNWRAEVLENSAYTKIMRTPKDKDIDRPMVQQAYGYNAMSKILGDTPMMVKTVNGIKMVDMPRGLYENATCYEYSATGLLLGWYYHPVGTQYVVNNPTCALVEAISGQVAQYLDEKYDTQVQMLDPELNYRMYVCSKIGGQYQNDWRDVTDSAMYGVVDNKLTWLINMTNYATLVRSDKMSLGYMVNVPSKKGLMEIDLIKVVTKNGVTGAQVLDVPLGELDIFLNGRSIQESFDYNVNKVGNKLIIFNKKYLYNPGLSNQQVVIRFTGFCKKDLSREKVDDKGFVKWGVLSRNATFNIRDDRVLRIVADGRLYHRDNLLWSETDQTTSLPVAVNGVPYTIRDLVVPMRSLTDGDTYSLREASRAIDKSVSDYLSTKLPEPDPGVPNVIPNMYPVFTPFLCKIMNDLIDGVIDTDQLKSQYNDVLIRKICAPYEYILAFDPTQTANLQDPNYVTVNPHQLATIVELDIYHYTFLKHVIALYMKGRTTLDNFVSIKTIPV